MKLYMKIGTALLQTPDKLYKVSNNVRSLRDGTRAASEVVYSMPDHLPYDPEPFPKGVWSVSGVSWQKEKGFDPRTYGPVKILTNAWRRVRVWELDPAGDYLRETDTRTRDTCYWLHYSAFPTTLGCVRLASPEDAVELANLIVEALQSETVSLEVS
jgi:hypothetical protein